ncbi:serpin-Z2A-like [Lolium rigidum]|uniref:serpin-Z2A-like n=1 Tax=Lolium rigidum TaxID=89674 RepID=UPI001F5C3458|nr:serpin-Z2A-like [Lolium rigidum]
MDKEARPSKKEKARQSKETRQGKKARSSVDSAGLTALALRLANTFSKGENIIFSPLSIYTALGLVAAGARGKTLDEILAVLGASSREEVAEVVRGVAESALATDGSGPLIITFACGVWHQKGLALKPAYRAAAVESYKAEASAVDFQEDPEGSRAAINGWVAEATNKLIASLLPPDSVHEDIRLVLANAMYFKGKWEDRFHQSLTKDADFYRLDGSTVSVPFMTSGRLPTTGTEEEEDFPFFFFEQEEEVKYFVASYDDGFKVLKLPYQAPNGGKYSMCVFLPDARDGLPSLADEMASGGRRFLFDHLPDWRISVDKLLLPRFKLSFSCSMKETLQTLGLRAAFCEEADLSDMVDDSGQDMKMRVEDVFHKAVVEVNEEGTEAAVSTAATSVLQCYRTPFNFVADHPFAFFILEEVSSTVLFAGHVLDPSNSSE